MLKSYNSIIKEYEFILKLNIFQPTLKNYIKTSSTKLDVYLEVYYNYEQSIHLIAKHFFQIRLCYVLLTQQILLSYSQKYLTFRIFVAPENDVILLVTYTKRNALTFLIKHGEEFPNDLSNQLGTLKIQCSHVTGQTKTSKIRLIFRLLHKDENTDLIRSNITSHRKTKLIQSF